MNSKELNSKEYLMQHIYENMPNSKKRIEKYGDLRAEETAKEIFEELEHYNDTLSLRLFRSKRYVDLKKNMVLKNVRN